MRNMRTFAGVRRRRQLTYARRMSTNFFSEFHLTSSPPIRTFRSFTTTRERGKARHEWPTSRIRTAGARRARSDAFENPGHPGWMRYWSDLDVAAAARSHGPRRGAVSRRGTLRQHARAIPDGRHGLIAVSVERTPHA